MNNTISSEQEAILNQLLKEVISLHSFNYSTLAEAKKIACIGDVEYCFDALSLCEYYHNLDPMLYDEFDRRVSRHYRETSDKETRKERDERVSLFKYLMTDSCPYQDFHIAKERRPDFILEGDGKRIGIEVVGLTTPHDQILFSISRTHFGQGKTASEIKKAVEQKPKIKSQRYEYWDINGSACIGTGLFDIGEKQKHFANQFYDKYKKYEEMIPSFDGFVVLGDATRVGDITLSDEEDVDNVFEWLKAAADLTHVSFVVLWQKNGASEISVSQYDVA